ncbi:hypothetical protein [Lactobacillus gigeriorum]|uniref:Holin n=1 Tax=Lactobacillus gigeriorum DSM 23908 = CRBIP 24.85 TaxID=1423751 RepID=I7K0W3_9LACO|nr:hypothetical protein [Lactobacillus gigeriorum]KRN12805.1 hypothetical protein FC38_GL000280 [Lactobacillus gigeriorum DSM 23908 = CRBIP 24.85]CCI87105.1 Putative uncharacterized protein [Lactobacillus gigeriorum DSM 23908 = CRBIP 24.85]
MPEIDQAVLISIITGVFSGGVFTFLQFLIKRHDDRTNNVDAKNKLVEDALLAILHDKIYVTGSRIIAQGTISAEDASNLDKLYEPYKQLGGNGTCERIMKKIEELPLKVED